MPKKTTSITRRTLIQHGSALMASLGVSVPAFAGSGTSQSKGHATQTLALSGEIGGRSLALNLVWGDIRVSGHDESTIDVQMATVFDGDDAAAPELFVREKGDEVEVEVMPPTTGGFWSADLDIKVPRAIELRLGMERGGNIYTKGVQGTIRIHNKNGSVGLRGLANSPDVKADNGEIVAHFDQLNDEHDISLISGNGKIDVALPAETGARLDLWTPRGGVFSDFEIQKLSGDIDVQTPIREDVYLKSDEGHFVGTLNGGGRLIKLSAKNGPIILRRLG